MILKVVENSRAGYTKFAVGIDKKNIPLNNEFTSLEVNNIIEEEYDKIKLALNETMRDFRKLDEGVLDFIKRGFSSAKDAFIKIGQKIRDTILKFFKSSI